MVGWTPEIRAVSAIIPHPGYKNADLRLTDTEIHDIALIKLAEPSTLEARSSTSVSERSGERIVFRGP